MAARDWKEFNKAWRARPGQPLWYRLRAARHRAMPRLRRWDRFVRRAEPWGISLAGIGLILAVLTFWYDYSDRVEERTVRAWQVLTTKAPGNSGKREALEYLNSESSLCFLAGCKRRVPLTGIDLSVEEGQEGTYLVGANLVFAELAEADFSSAWFYDANLSGAMLNSADFSSTSLTRTNFSGAFLYSADFSEAQLTSANLSNTGLARADLSSALLIDANLSGAYIREANLRGAILSGADLSGAKLMRSDLSEADLSSAVIQQKQLRSACGDEGTRLPEGVTIRMCSEQRWYENLHGDRAQ